MHEALCGWQANWILMGKNLWADQYHWYCSECLLQTNWLIKANGLGPLKVHTGRPVLISPFNQLHSFWRGNTADNSKKFWKAPKAMTWSTWWRTYSGEFLHWTSCFLVGVKCCTTSRGSQKILPWIIFILAVFCFCKKNVLFWDLYCWAPLRS